MSGMFLTKKNVKDFTAFYIFPLVTKAFTLSTKLT